MDIIKTKRFKNELQKTMEFIAKDSLQRAFEFEANIENKIKNIPNFPYKHRKSFKSKDNNIRDLIYKAYVIPYKIYQNKILILGIFNRNEWNI